MATMWTWYVTFSSTWLVRLRKKTTLPHCAKTSPITILWQLCGFPFLCTSNIEHGLTDGQRLYIAGFTGLLWSPSSGVRLGCRLRGGCLSLCFLDSTGFCPSFLHRRFIHCLLILILRRVGQTKSFNKVRGICIHAKKTYCNTNIEYIGQIQ